MTDMQGIDGQFGVLIGFSFGNALMLFFGLATAIPLLIHLWSRNRYAEHRFAAMEFLMRAVRKHAKRIAIENWFLLILRTLILVLFVVAIADPLWPTSPYSAKPRTARGSQLWIVVLDHSFSMGAVQSGQTRLQVAQRQLAQLLEQAPDGDAFSLIAMGREAKTVIGEPVYDRREVSRYAEGLRLSPGTARLAQTLERVEQVLDTARGWSDAFDTYRVLFISDMGKVTWSTVQQSDNQMRIRKIGQLATLAALDVGNEIPSQFAIGQVTRDAAWALPGQSITLDLQLHAYGETDGESTRVNLLIDGQPVADRIVNWNRERQRTESFLTSFNAPGEYVATFQLGNDPLSFDNQFQHIVRIRPRIRVLLVGTRPTDTKALATALTFEGRLNEAVECQEIVEHEWSMNALSAYDVVVLSNVERIRREMGGQLRDFVDRGGCLLVGLGPDIDASSYNARLGGDEGVLPCTLTDQVFTGETALKLGTGHPVMELFEETQNSGIESVPIWSHQTVELDRGSDDRVRLVLNYATGSPGLLEKRQGDGTCFLFTSSFQLASSGLRGGDAQVWSPLSVWPTFLPLVHELITHGLQHQDRMRNLRVGDSLEFVTAQDPPSSLTIGDPADAPTIVFPGGRRENALASPDRPELWYWPNSEEVGVYQVELRTEQPFSVARRALKFAVEYEAAESDLERVDGKLLPSQIEMVEEIDVAANEVIPHQTRQRPYQSMLILLFVFLLLETWLAMRVGRPAEPSSKNTLRSFARHVPGRSPQGPQAADTRVTSQMTERVQFKQRAASRRYSQDGRDL